MQDGKVVLFLLCFDDTVIYRISPEGPDDLWTAPACPVDVSLEQGADPATRMFYKYAGAPSSISLPISFSVNSISLSSHSSRLLD